MGPSLLLAVDEDRDALADVEAQLVRRYAQDYRVECLADPAQALRLLTELAHDGEEVALVSGAQPARAVPRASICSTTCGSSTRTRSARSSFRRTSGEIRNAAEAIRTSLALGRIDYYVPSPAGSLDEVFHAAVSSFLLEWARDRGSRPADRSHRRRDVVGSSLRAEKGLRAVRGSAQLLPGRFGPGA